MRIQYYKAICPCGKGYIKREKELPYKIDDDWGREHERGGGVRDTMACADCNAKYYQTKSLDYLELIWLPKGMVFHTHRERPSFSFNENIVQKYSKLDIQAIINDTVGKQGKYRRSMSDCVNPLSHQFMSDWRSDYWHNQCKAVKDIQAYLYKLLDDWDKIVEQCASKKNAMAKWDADDVEIKKHNQIVLANAFKPVFVFDDEANARAAMEEEESKYTSFDATVVYDSSYRINYINYCYDTWQAVECVDDNCLILDKSMKRVTVFKKYKCKCIKCGRERIFRSDELYKHPIELGDDYSLYISEQYECVCHRSSSFECKVMDILHSLNVRYLREMNFADLTNDMGYLLYLDFVIYEPGKDGFADKAFALELNGPQHYEAGYYLNDGSYEFIKDNTSKGLADLNRRKQNDMIKKNYCKYRGLPYECIKYTKSDIVKLYDYLQHLLDKYGIKYERKMIYGTE